MRPTRGKRLIGATPRGAAQRAVIFWGIGIGLALFVLGIILAIDVLMVAFTGLLVAVLLRSLSDQLHRRARLGEGWALAVTVLALVALCVLGVWLMSPRIATQFETLREAMPRAVESFRERMGQYEVGRWLLSQAPAMEGMVPRRQDLFSRMTGVVSATIGAIGTVMIVVALGLYFAAAPESYLRGAVFLVPKRRRPRARTILDLLGATLKDWLVGKILSMLIVGVLTWIGLMLMGIELALTLALLAALLTFIPNFGPIISAVPAVLLGMMDGPMMGLWVALLYIGIQVVESYVITPFIQQRTLSLPPALTLTTQLIMGVLLGGFGLALATPLTAVAVVLARELYVRDVLGDRQAKP